MRKTNIIPAVASGLLGIASVMTSGVPAIAFGVAALSFAFVTFATLVGDRG